jgi:hypothetical protein
MRVHAEQGETDLTLRQYPACREMLAASDTEENIRDMQVDEAVTNRALKLLGSRRNDAYEAALVDALDGLAVDAVRFGEAVESPDAGSEVIERGKELKVTPVTAAQDLAKVFEAVDALLDTSEFPAAGAGPVFHLAVVLEGGDVIGRRLQAQDACGFVVHLDHRLAEMVLDAGSLDPLGNWS